VKILICDVEDWEKGRFQGLSESHEVVFCTRKLSAETVEQAPDAEVLSGFIHSPLDATLLEKLPKLEFVATRSTGYDHIDLDYCREHGITVSNVPTYGDNTVAEHVFGLILTISHRLAEALDRTRKGDFSQAGLQGFDLLGKTLGVVGTGSIGRHVIRIARGFGMKVLAFDVQAREELARKLGFRYTSMEELLEASDIVTLHVPATPKTRHLIGEKQFGQMKTGCVLINTSRGTVVDVQALIEAIASGTVAAAGLDVLPEEPAVREEAELLRKAFRDRHNLEALLADHILLRMRNVYVTPHSAFNTREAVERILDTTIENIERFASGQPQNVVAGP